MSKPRELPSEIVSQILRVATHDLVLAEREEPVLTPLTNHFLISASLVARDWRKLAQTLLVQHGLLTPSGERKYLLAVARENLATEITSVRVTQDWPTWEKDLPEPRLSRSSFEVGNLVQRISEHLPLLCSVEALSCTPGWWSGSVWPGQTKCPTINYTRQTNNGILPCGSHYRPKGLTPKAVLFTQSTHIRPSPSQTPCDPSSLAPLLSSASSIHLTFNSTSSLVSALVALRRSGGAPTLTSLSLDTYDGGYRKMPSHVFQQPFPALKALSIPIFLLPAIPHVHTNPDHWPEGHLPPSLERLTLKRTALVRFEGPEWPKVLARTLELLTSLKRLEVPKGWVWEEVAEECQRRGVELIATSCEC
ncbi:hypothetical protein RQP46_002490 [Phenoliferia psychrophenolica]